jgi:hypothetical protein
MSTTYPQKFTGSITWLYPTKGTFERFPVSRALLHSPSELVIDCDCGSAHEPYLYTISLRRTVDNRFEGPFGAGRTFGSQSTGKASGRLYTADSGLVLRGTWQEDEQSEFIVELIRVAHFADEQA